MFNQYVYFNDINMLDVTASYGRLFDSIAFFGIFIHIRSFQKTLGSKIRPVAEWVLNLMYN